MDWKLPNILGTKITAMGLGRFGGQIAAIQFCAMRGAKILVTDQSSREMLADSLESFGTQYPDITFQFGEHKHKYFIDADLILVSPAVAPHHECLQLAAQQAIPILTEQEIFLANCEAKIIALTGTVGKSTTATMVQHLLNQLGISNWLGGNIGQSLLPDLPQIASDDWVILELSSFQLHWLSRKKQQYEIAVLTNYFPHHLDWHQNEDHYRRCKTSIFRDQTETQFAVLPTELKEEKAWKSVAQINYFSEKCDEIFPQHWAAHQKQNAEAAITVVARVCEKEGIKITRKMLGGLLCNYSRLSHRLEIIAEKQGRRFINDSKATSPQATVAAIDSLDQPSWIIVGGASISDDLTELISAFANNRNLRGIACVGTTGSRILQKLAADNTPQKNKIQYGFYASLQQATLWCWENSEAGDTILLSPACPSYDEFQNYEHRGNSFAEYIEEL